MLDYSPGSWYATTPQQMEFLASKAVGFDGAVSLEMAGGVDGLDGGVTTNGRALEAAEKMGAWLKNNISLPASVLQLLQRPGLDHELSQDAEGWWITPVKVHSPFVADPKVPSSLLASLPPAFGNRSFAVRVRAMTTAALLGDPANIVLVSGSTTDHLTTVCPATFVAKPGQIPVPIPNGSLTVALEASPPRPSKSTIPAKSLRLNLTAPTEFGIGCARFTFQRGSLNLTAHRPLGLRVHGDASGALMNVQLEESRGLIQDFFVNVDFTGWKEIELNANENSGMMFKDMFPRTAFPDDLRGFHVNAVVALNVYLTNSTRSSIYIGSIEALQEASQGSSTRGAKITVDEFSLSIPDGLEAAVCLPGSNCSHGGPSGGCSDYAECDLITAKCRSFGADNVRSMPNMMMTMTILY